MDNQSKAFKELQKTWYKKLKQTGFDDIEQDEEYLKEYSTTVFAIHRLRNPARAESVAEYYRLATHFLHDYKFKTALDKRIWFHHAEGKSCREIEKILRKDRIAYKKTSINAVIIRLRKEMVNVNT